MRFEPDVAGGDALDHDAVDGVGSGRQLGKFVEDDLLALLMEVRRALRALELHFVRNAADQLEIGLGLGTGVGDADFIGRVRAHLDRVLGIDHFQHDGRQTFDHGDVILLFLQASGGLSGNQEFELTQVDGHAIELHFLGLTGSDLADEPGDGSRGEVVPAAVTGRRVFETRRKNVVDGHVGGGGVAWIRDLQGISGFSIEITALRPGDFQSQARHDHVHVGLVLSLEVALGLGQGIADLHTTLIGGADHLNAPGFARVQIAQLEIHLVALRVLQAFGQRGMQLDLLGRPVAGVGDRQDEGGAVADENLLGSGGFQKQLRLDDFDLI